MKGDLEHEVNTITNQNIEREQLAEFAREAERLKQTAENFVAEGGRYQELFTALQTASAALEAETEGTEAYVAAETAYNAAQKKYNRAEEESF